MIKFINLCLKVKFGFKSTLMRSINRNNCHKSPNYDLSSTRRPIQHSDLLLIQCYHELQQFLYNLLHIFFTKEGSSFIIPKRSYAFNLLFAHIYIGFYFFIYCTKDTCLMYGSSELLICDSFGQMGTKLT